MTSEAVEPLAEDPGSRIAKPHLKLVGLHVEGFRALQHVNWPADGLGWGETVPDIVVVGGVNGSGKTTLLELIAEAAQGLFVRGHRDGKSSPKTPACLQFELQCTAMDSTVFTWSTDDASPRELSDRFGVAQTYRIDDVSRSFIRKDHIHRLTYLLSTIADPGVFTSSDIPGVVYLPTDRRFDIPQETYKAAGKLTANDSFFYRFAAPTQWRDSLEALLYSARWADLNAKDEGHPERAVFFDSYARAFRAFFGDSKSLVWEGGELFIKVADTGDLHSLMDLSSGEKQALILAAELYRRWRPGSLILVDEPELHFHTSWQTVFYTMLERWQRERGGQVIIATQSNHLFRIAPPETTVLLKGPLA